MGKKRSSSTVNNTKKASVAAQEPPTKTDHTAQEQPTKTDGTVQEQPTKTDHTAQEPPTKTDDTAQEQPTKTDHSAQEQPTKTDHSAQEQPTKTDHSAQEQPTKTDGTAQEQPTKTDGTAQEPPTKTNDTAQEQPTKTDGTAQVTTMTVEETHIANPTAPVAPTFQAPGRLKLVSLDTIGISPPYQMAYDKNVKLPTYLKDIQQKNPDFPILFGIMTSQLLRECLYLLGQEINLSNTNASSDRDPSLSERVRFFGQSLMSSSHLSSTYADDCTFEYPNATTLRAEKLALIHNLHQLVINTLETFVADNPKPCFDNFVTQITTLFAKMKEHLGNLDKAKQISKNCQSAFSEMTQTFSPDNPLELNTPLANLKITALDNPLIKLLLTLLYYLHSSNMRKTPSTEKSHLIHNAISRQLVPFINHAPETIRLQSTLLIVNALKTQNNQIEANSTVVGTFKQLLSHGGNLQLLLDKLSTEIGNIEQVLNPATTSLSPASLRRQGPTTT